MNYSSALQHQRNISKREKMDERQTRNRDAAAGLKSDLLPLRRVCKMFLQQQQKQTQRMCLCTFVSVFKRCVRVPWDTRQLLQDPSVICCIYRPMTVEQLHHRDIRGTTETKRTQQPDWLDAHLSITHRLSCHCSGF